MSLWFARVTPRLLLGRAPPSPPPTAVVFLFASGWRYPAAALVARLPLVPAAAKVRRAFWFAARRAPIDGPAQRSSDPG